MNEVLLLERTKQKKGNELAKNQITEQKMQSEVFLLLFALVYLTRKKSKIDYAFFFIRRNTSLQCLSQ